MDLNKLEEFLKKEGRPWTLNDIHSKGFIDIPKNTVKNLLDILVQKNKIIVKENIFCYNFKNIPMSHNADEIQQRINKYSKKVREKEKEIKELEEVLNNNNIEEIPLSVLENQHTVLKKRIDELEIKVDGIKKRKGKTQANSSKLHKLRMKYDTCLREFNKRKIIGVSMLGQIMDISPKPKQVILDELDVETDEMVGFNISDYPAVKNKVFP